MIIKHKWLGCLLSINIALASFIGMLNDVCAQEPVEFLDWSIKTDKNAFYPGEPVLLTLNIRNMGSQEDEVDFGMDGIEAFSMKIQDSNNIVAEGGKIQRFGLTRMPYLEIHPGKTSQKSMILNQWCSTLLPPGKYQVVCDVEYRLRSEAQKQPDTIVMKAGPLHKIRLKLDIQIIEMDQTKFKEMLESLAAFEVKPETQSKGEWLAERDLKREMLALTESELAVPYQLHLLAVEQYTWRKRDIVNSLVRSGTPEAARGLVQVIEDPSIYKEDVKPILIDGVYRLRETGKAEILTATEDFVAKYKRPPVQLGPID